MVLTHRLAALVLSLGLLSVAWAAAPESTAEIPNLKFVQETRQVGVSYAPLDAQEAERIENVAWMQREIVNLWELFLDEKSFSVDEARKTELEALGRDLALSIEKYQRTPSNYKWWKPERKGTTLPTKADVHLMLATMAAIESKINPKAVGDLGEVGILQCHTWCRNGHTKQEIKENPQLGIELAVEFLAKSIDQCGIKLDSLRNKKLRDEAWSKPVSLYGAGNSALNKNSRCMAKNFARWRVDEMKRLRAQIRNQPGEGNGREKVRQGAAAARAAGSLRPDPA